MSASTDDVDAIMEKWRKEREAEIAKTRDELISKLDALGVTEVTARYEAYGDEGNVEELSTTPSDIKFDHDLEMETRNFAWSIAYDQHPGFEKNEGGYGELTWSIGDDSITLDHADRFVDYNHSYHEGL